MGTECAGNGADGASVSVGRASVEAIGELTEGLGRADRAWSHSVRAGRDLETMET